MTESDGVLERYATSLRRPRLIYFAVVTVIVVALGVFAGVVWSRGEAAHATLHTVARAPADLPLGRPDQPQQPVWHTADRLALGTPVAGGTVITYSAHTVRGHDARTGTTTWSYTRIDRQVCTAVQLSGRTMAVYAVHGNCDEVDAFDTGTGARAWTRTLDKDGMPLNGRPSYQWTSFTLMITSASTIYAIDPSTGLDRWTYTRFGCHIERAVLGSAGALISQNCVQPNCGNLVKCGAGQQLLLRDATAGNGDDSKADRDQVKWNDFGNSDVPVTAGQVVAGINRTTRVLDEYRVDTGKPLTSVSLAPAPSSLTGGSTSETTDTQLLWLSGVTFALSAGRSTAVWSTPTRSAPTVVSTTDNSTPALSTARLSVPTTSGLAVLDGNTGATSLRFTVPVPAAGSVVWPLGAGFVVGGPAGTVAYR